MQAYEYHPQTNTYRNSADWAAWENAEGQTIQVNSMEDLPPAGDGFEWRAGEPEGLEPYQPETLQQRLADTYNSLPPEARGAFLPLKAAVWKEIEAPEPDLEAVWHLVNQTQVPPDLEAAKAALLAELPTP